MEVKTEGPSQRPGMRTMVGFSISVSEWWVSELRSFTLQN
jgi:hypothetical protein